jgi:ParB-like nuclease domain
MGHLGSDAIALARCLVMRSLAGIGTPVSGHYFSRWLLPMNKPTSVGSPSRLAVTYRPVGDLIPDPRNARTHPKRQIEQLRASIEAFGFTNPVLADPDGRIIAGHGRVQAARAMGLAEDRPSPCLAYRIPRSGRSVSPTTRSRSTRAGIWKFCRRNWASSLRSMSTSILL